MISVFHVRNSNYPGGIETTLLGWFRAIDPSRFNMRLFVFRERGNIHERSVRLMAENGVQSDFLPWGHMRNLPGAVHALVKEIRAENHVIVHSHDARSDVVALLAARLTGAPVIVSNHAWHAVGFKRRMMEYVRGKLLPLVDLVLNVSEDTHQETIRRGVPQIKSMPLYSGIDLLPFERIMDRDAVRTGLGLGADEFVASNVARLWPEKAQDALIEAVSLLGQAGRPMKLLIVGDGPLEASLRKQAIALGVESSVVFLGFRSDYADIMNASDAFVFPSSAEGTPMVLYGAMAMRLPIIASTVAGNAEILANNDTALLVPPANALALRDALQQLIDNPVLGRRLGEQAYAVVHERYSVDKTVRNLEAIYERFFVHGRGRPTKGRRT